MDEKNDNTLTPVIMGERNEILREYANHSLNSALAEVNSKIELEKDHEMKLGLLAAKRSPTGSAGKRAQDKR